MPGLDSTRLQALLAYLLLHRDAPQLRQHLAFLFWPDSDEAQARTNLRNLLHRMRQAWPQATSYLRIETKSIRWNPEASLTLDVAEFEAHLSRAAIERDNASQLKHLQQALALYRGELLPSCYDDWIQPERTRLHQAFLQALERTAGMLETLDDVQGALQVYRRLIQVEPLQEAAYRRLMELHLRSGNRAAALQAYYRCATTLERELGLTPDAATQEIYHRLLEIAGPASHLPSATGPMETSLIGRSVEWEQLQLSWRRVAAGQRGPLMVLIRGEAGVGKTRLATELTDWAQRQGITTAAAACYAPEATLSLVPVVSWLRALSLEGVAPIWSAELARLLPELAPRITPQPSASNRQSAASASLMEAPTEPLQKRRFFEALAKAILTQPQPLLLRLEDVQWSDIETLGWLHYLMRMDAKARLMIVATLRVEEIGSEHPILPLLSTLRQQDRLLEIELLPLTANDTAMLAESLLGVALSAEMATALYKYTEGNPLFIVQTLCNSLECSESAAPFQTLITASPRWGEETALPLPPKMRAVLRERVGQLSPKAHSLLEVASVIGRSFTSEVLRDAAGIDEGEMVTALDELWRRRIIRSQEGDVYDFSHDKLRQVVYDMLSPARRRWLHGQVARALETLAPITSPELWGRLAFHFEAAGQAQRALHFHQEAAANAQQLYAYQEAAFHLQRAIAMLDRVVQEERQRPRLQEQLGDVLALLGRHEEARQAYDSALSIPPQEASLIRAALTLKLAQTWKAQYHLEQAWAICEKSLERLGLPTQFGAAHWQIWLDIRLEQLDTLYFLADLERMTGLIEIMRTPLETHGTLQQRANYHVIRIQMESRRTRFRHDDEVVGLAQAALRLAQAAEDEILVQRCRFGLGFVLLWRGEITLAIEALKAGAISSENAGNIPLLDRCLTYLTIAYRLMGQTQQVRELLPRCVAVAQSEENEVYLGVALANQAWLAYRAGDFATAAAQAHAALDHWRKLAFPFHWLAAWPALAVAAKRGDWDTAITHARDMLAAEQHKLPDSLEDTLRAAIAAYPENSRQIAAQLSRAIALARQESQL